jgi:hypothetical protein
MIIGRTPAALLYAWRLQREVILTEPFSFHRLSDEYEGVDFSEFKAANVDEFVSNMFFIMGLTNLLKHPNNVSSYRLEDRAIITKHNTRVYFDGEPEVFDGELTGHYQVFDEFYWRKGRVHDILLLEDDDDFCSKIHFYTSLRGLPGATKDFTVVSKMDEKQLLDVDYGNGLVRIKAARMMKQAGITGEISRVYNCKTYYKRPVFDFNSRIALPRIKQKFNFKEVMKMKQKEGEAWKAWKKLTSKESTWLGLSR